MARKYTKVTIPTPLYKRIEEKLLDSDYSSVSEYIIKILNENFPDDQDSEKTYNKEDEEKVKDRLKSLGYLD